MATISLLFQWLQHLLGCLLSIFLQKEFFTLQADLDELRIVEMLVIAWLASNKESPHFQDMTGIRNALGERVTRLGELNDQLCDLLQKIEFQDAKVRLMAKRLNVP